MKLADNRPLSRAEFHERLRRIGAERYHDRHPFHARLHGGECSPDEVRAWVINRWMYQSRIPMKDAAFMSRVEDPDLRRHWRKRIEDHDGTVTEGGGIRRWLALAQAVIYLALAPKSNAGYAAYKAARAEAKKTGSLMPPAHILNAPTQMMKDQGYGAGYAYDHDAEDGFSGQNYFPDGMKRPVLYVPVERGFERELKKRLDWFVSQRLKRGG